eukprot:517258-Pelagomonas_calceolata.AAC.1
MIDLHLALSLGNYFHANDYICAFSAGNKRQDGRQKQHFNQGFNEISRPTERRPDRFQPGYDRVSTGPCLGNSKIISRSVIQFYGPPGKDFPGPLFPVDVWTGKFRRAFIFQKAQAKTKSILKVDISKSFAMRFLIVPLLFVLVAGAHHPYAFMRRCRRSRHRYCQEESELEECEDDGMALGDRHKSLAQSMVTTAAAVSVLEVQANALENAEPPWPTRVGKVGLAMLPCCIELGALEFDRCVVPLTAVRHPYGKTTTRSFASLPGTSSLEEAIEAIPQEAENKLWLRPVCGEQLAACLIFLANGSCYGDVAGQMNYSRTTIFRAAHDVAYCLSTYFPNKLRFPRTTDQMMQNAAGFYKRGQHKGGTQKGIPHIVGAIDGTHVAIRNPQKGQPGYFNRKQYTSINVCAICDHRGRFLSVHAGEPGSVHDSAVLQSSNFGHNLHLGWIGSLMWGARTLVNSVAVPFSIIADSAYATKTFMIPAYKDCSRQDRARTIFNTKHAATRNVVERAFGRLKCRWRCLLKQNDLTLEYVNNMITACFVLHNICEECKEVVAPPDDELLSLLEQYYSMFPTERRHDINSVNMHLNDGNAPAYSALFSSAGDGNEPPPNRQENGRSIREMLTGFVNQLY